jgi:predicted ATP-grasp superfamily ATP-dependent carboligase
LSKRVLVTYGWVRSSYAAVRNLAEHGVEVVVADTNRLGMCQWSKYPKSRTLYRSHYQDEEGFVADMERICQEQKVDVILSSHNETEILARHRERFPDSLIALLPNAEHCALFNNKARAYELAKGCGVPVPRRFDYGSPDELDHALRQGGYQRLVVKLLSGNGAKGIFYANDPVKAKKLVKELIEEFKLSPERFPQVEERVDGEGWGCSSLYWYGEPVASFCHRRLREKTVSGGTSTYREAVEHPELEAHANRILSKLGWHGLAMVEYKVNPETGQIWFIEVNPRMWGSIHLSIAAGYEFPYLAWLCATEGVEAAIEYHSACPKQIGHRARWLLGDMIIVAGQLRRGRIRAAGRILFRQPADSFDDWNWRDPMAFFGELAYYGISFLRNRSTNPVEKGMIG